MDVWNYKVVLDFDLFESQSKIRVISKEETVLLLSVSTYADFLTFSSLCIPKRFLLWFSLGTFTNLTTHLTATDSHMI